MAPEQLVYDRSTIAFENRVFPITARKGTPPLYDRNEVDTYLAPLLTRATRLGPLAMLRYRLSHRDPTLILPIAWFAVCAAVLIATGIYKLVLAHLLVG